MKRRTITLTISWDQDDDITYPLKRITKQFIIDNIKDGNYTKIKDATRHIPNSRRPL
jgi:hypothetical protein